jgi:hypothetical protein
MRKWCRLFNEGRINMGVYSEEPFGHLSVITEDLKIRIDQHIKAFQS